MRLAHRAAEIAAERGIDLAGDRQRCHSVRRAKAARARSGSSCGVCAVVTAAGSVAAHASDFFQWVDDPASIDPQGVPAARKSRCTRSFGGTASRRRVTSNPDSAENAGIGRGDVGAQTLAGEAELDVRRPETCAVTDECGGPDALNQPCRVRKPPSPSTAGRNQAPSRWP